MSELTSAHKDKLMTDLKQVMTDAEALLAATSDDASASMSQLRARVSDTLLKAKDGLIEAQDAMVGKAKAAAKATDHYVHENPWQAVGIAAGVGLLLGMLISRR
jgi:ElaB/YqjD/DUF883 family membrane-anchored ribosome-binding protein